MFFFFFSANNANKAAFSDLENGTIKNGDASKHRGDFGSDTQPQQVMRMFFLKLFYKLQKKSKFAIFCVQRPIGDNSGGSDSKATKRRRSEDFDYFRRNDLTSKDISKDMFARVHRTDTIAKDGKH